MDHPSVRGCVAISGVYDLEPMRHCYVNDKLRLDEDAGRSATRQSGNNRRPPCQLAVVVGGSEVPLMYQQSADYAAEQAKLAYRLPFTRYPVPTTFPSSKAWSVPMGASWRSCARRLPRPTFRRPVDGHVRETSEGCPDYKRRHRQPADKSEASLRSRPSNTLYR